jgi:hypothetical protein
MTHVVLDLGSHSASSDIPYEALAVRPATDEDHTLSTSRRTTQDINEDQRLDTLSLGMASEGADHIASGQVDDLNETVCATGSSKLAVGRDSESGDAVM